MWERIHRTVPIIALRFVIFRTFLSVRLKHFASPLDYAVQSLYAESTYAKRTLKFPEFRSDGIVDSKLIDCFDITGITVTADVSPRVLYDWVSREVVDYLK